MCRWRRRITTRRRLFDGSQRDHSGGEDIEHQRIPIWLAAEAWGVLRGSLRFAGFQTRFRPAEGRRDKGTCSAKRAPSPIRAILRFMFVLVFRVRLREAPEGFFGGAPLRPFVPPVGNRLDRARIHWQRPLPTPAARACRSSGLFRCACFWSKTL